MSHAKRQNTWCTGHTLIQPSPAAMCFGQWPKEQKPGCEQPKWVLLYWLAELRLGGDRRWGAWGKAAAAAAALPHGTSWYSHLIKKPPWTPSFGYLQGISHGERAPQPAWEISYWAKRCFWLPCRSHGIRGWMDRWELHILEWSHHNVNMSVGHIFILRKQRAIANVSTHCPGLSFFIQH